MAMEAGAKGAVCAKVPVATFCAFLIDRPRALSSSALLHAESMERRMAYHACVLNALETLQAPLAPLDLRLVSSAPSAPILAASAESEEAYILLSGTMSVLGAHGCEIASLPPGAMVGGAETAKEVGGRKFTLPFGLRLAAGEQGCRLGVASRGVMVQAGASGMGLGAEAGGATCGGGEGGRSA